MRRGVRTGSEKRDTRFRGTGRVAWVTRCTGELRPRNPPLGRRANRRGLLSCRLALRTPAPPHVAFLRALRTSTCTEDDGSELAHRQRQRPRRRQGRRQRPRPDAQWRKDGLGKTRHAVARDGAACMGGPVHWGARATQPAPRAARQSEGVAVMPIGTSHARSTPCRVFASPPHVDLYAGARVGMGSTASGRSPGAEAAAVTGAEAMWRLRSIRSRSPPCGQTVEWLSSWSSRAGSAWPLPVIRCPTRTIPTARHASTTVCGNATTGRRGGRTRRIHRPPASRRTSELPASAGVTECRRAAAVRRQRASAGGTTRSRSIRCAARCRVRRPRRLRRCGHGHDRASDRAATWPSPA